MSGSKIKKNASGSEIGKTAVTTMPVVRSDVKKPSASAQKQTTFQIRTKSGSKVFLAGDFNNWDCATHELLEKDGSGLYQRAVSLKPGTYEYKFHINGIWCVDPENPDFKSNQMGTLNSVIIVE